MDFAFILDPLPQVKAYKDSTVAMMRALAARGHRVHALEQSDVHWRDGATRARARPLALHQDNDHWYTAGEPETRTLKDYTAVLMRKDPPFDMEYVYSTYLLEAAESEGARVFNRPRAIRDYNEKMAIARFPEFNASLVAKPGGDELVLKKYFNVGFAADTPNGLVVPVIRNADQKGVLQIAKEMAALSAKARDGKLGPADMQGGCFSISSLGGIGGTAFTPIINAPEVAILGVSKSAMKPSWDGKTFVPRLMLPLSLSYDHRVIDGASAARFTAYLSAVLGDLRRSLL